MTAIQRSGQPLLFSSKTELLLLVGVVAFIALALFIFDSIPVWGVVGLTVICYIGGRLSMWWEKRLR